MANTHYYNKMWTLLLFLTWFIYKNIKWCMNDLLKYAKAEVLYSLFIISRLFNYNGRRRNCNRIGENCREPVGDSTTTLTSRTFHPRWRGVCILGKPSAVDRSKAAVFAFPLEFTSTWCNDVSRQLFLSLCKRKNLKLHCCITQGWARSLCNTYSSNSQPVLFCRRSFLLFIYIFCCIYKAHNLMMAAAGRV